MRLIRSQEGAWFRMLVIWAVLALPAAGSVIEWTDETVYEVTITTSLDIPKEETVGRIRVIHCLPMENAWSQGEKKSAARRISSTPPGGRIKHDTATGGSYVEWENRVAADGGKFEFTTTYETTSATRHLSEKGLAKARWKSRSLSGKGTIHPEIYEQAQLLIKEESPIQALQKFSVWLEQRVAYDASVETGASVQEVMERGRGHCGHRGAVFHQFARALGIPTRPSGGATLGFADGGIDQELFAIKPIYSNVHVWSELDLPGLGWVEMEPIAGEKMFHIPHSYIRTRGVSQNYRAEVQRNGKWERTVWSAVEEGGKTKFVSPVGERNVIAFKILDTKTAAAAAEEEENQALVRTDEVGNPAGESSGLRQGSATVAARTMPAASRLEEAVLAESVTFEIHRNGAAVGKMTLQPGGSVNVLDRNGSTVLIGRGVAEPRWVEQSALVDAR